MSLPTFDEDVSFMQAFGPVSILPGPGDARIAVSARWQARVMTSAFGPGARSLGFVNRPFLQAGRTGTHFDNYGGEDRFWLGPEGGQHGLYFAPGAPFTLDTWQVPHALQEGPWSVEGHAGDRSITFARRMKLTSRSGFEFPIAITRQINVLDAAEVEARFGGVPPAAHWVAFETVNRITNAGTVAWTKATGLPSVWILGQYPATADSSVIVPFCRGAGPIVNDGYFGAVPADRLRVREAEGVLVFKADGKHRSKIGLGPARAKAILGSHSPEARLLTLVRYSLPGAGEYVNSMWEEQRDPYDGDVVNSYNDGPVGAEREALGAFYELETSSPGAALAPGESASHAHATLHLADAPASLDEVALRVLGVTLTDVAKV